jgi:hypothetical protein
MGEEVLLGLLPSDYFASSAQHDTRYTDRLPLPLLGWSTAHLRRLKLTKRSRYRGTDLQCQRLELAVQLAPETPNLDTSLPPISLPPNASSIHLQEDRTGASCNLGLHHASSRKDPQPNVKTCSCSTCPSPTMGTFSGQLTDNSHLRLQHQVQQKSKNSLATNPTMFSSTPTAVSEPSPSTDQRSSTLSTAAWPARLSPDYGSGARVTWPTL